MGDNNISDSFSNSQDGEIYQVPSYDVLNVPVLLSSSGGNYLVHEKVPMIDRVAGSLCALFLSCSGIEREPGSGDMKNDRVVSYTKAEFEGKYGDGDYVSIEKYRNDSSQIQSARLEVGHDTPVVEAADFMKMRLEEIPRDLEAYKGVSPDASGMSFSH